MKSLGLILGAVLLCLSLQSCGPTVAQVREKIDAAKQTIATLSDAAAKLAELAKLTGDPKTIELAATAQKAVDIVSAQLPALEAELAKADGGAPWWSVLASVVGTFVLPRLAGLIPIAGPILQAFLAAKHWDANATKKQKQDDL